MFPVANVFHTSRRQTRIRDQHKLMPCTSSFFPYQLVLAARQRVFLRCIYKSKIVPRPQEDPQLSESFIIAIVSISTRYASRFA